MAKFEIEMTELNIDVSMFTEEQLRPELHRSLDEVHTDHSKKQSASQRPDGSAQKENSEPYKSYKQGMARTRGKNAGKSGINTGSQWKHGTVPTILTGALNASRQIRPIPGGVEGFLAGDNAKKARGLVEKGYGLHFFSEQNIKTIEQRVATWAAKQLGRAFGGR